ncbi:ferredoxin domain-containing protein [Desulfothermobacter acidiphilus]|uniref:ferredoxin domain-containing protein n=1 Tax=Desulfothermobacter acidiphilus TaxID=1938353 RepID=UPI003F8CA7CB
MVLAARTAPKSRGEDYLVLRVLTGEEVLRLGEAMIEYGKKTGKKNFDRDGDNVKRSAAVLLVGLRDAKPLGLNCGACGWNQCQEMPPLREGPEFRGPFCFWRAVDLGIAVGSAVKTASLHNVDNRIMYRAGVVARQLGLIEAEVVLAVPLSVTGKNIYFDRKE